MDKQYIMDRRAGLMAMYNHDPEIINGWIPIIIGEPLDNMFFDWVLVKYILCDSKNSCYGIAKMRGHSWYDQFNLLPIDYYKDKQVTHWQLLPEL